MIKDKLKEINDINYKINKSKDEKERENLDKKLQDIMKDIKKGIIESFKDESDLKRFLDNIVNFNNYSYTNQLLIWTQKPEAKYVTSLHKYNKMGYTIKSGAKSIKIFAPNTYSIVKIKENNDKYEYKPYFALTDEEKKIYRDKNDDTITFHKSHVSGFKITNVFDVSDTTMPIEKIEKELNPILDDERAKDIEDIFVKAIYKDGFKVERVDKIDNGAKGYCDFENSKIVLLKGLGSLTELNVLIHEYAHSLAHKHLENNNKEYQEHRHQYETEAESISYVVSKYLGLDTAKTSNPYLYFWSKDKDFQEIDNSLNVIVNYSKRIIDNYNKFYENEFELSNEDIKTI